MNCILKRSTEKNIRGVRCPGLTVDLRDTAGGGWRDFDLGAGSWTIAQPSADAQAQGPEFRPNFPLSVAKHRGGVFSPCLPPTIRAAHPGPLHHPQAMVSGRKAQVSWPWLCLYPGNQLICLCAPSGRGAGDP